MNRTLWSAIVAPLLASFLFAASERPVTVRDCVETRRIVENQVKISPDGSHVAYVVKSPQVDTNRNNYELYIRDLQDDNQRENGRVLLRADLISGIRWLGSNRIVARTEMNSETGGSKSEISIVNVLTGNREALSFSAKVSDYTISADGNTVVYSSEAAMEARIATENEEKRKRSTTYGYPILFGKGSGIAGAPEIKKFEVFIRKRTKAGKFGESVKLYFRGPEDLPRRSALGTPKQFSLSPDGKHLLLVFQLDDAPIPWRGDPLIEFFRGMGSGASFVLGLYDLQTEQLRMGFNFPGELLSTKWSDDSRGYAVVGPSPLGSAEHQEEIQDGIRSGNLYWHIIRYSHVFVSDVNSGKTTKVISRDSQEPGNPVFSADVPLVWEHENGDMLIRAGEREFVRVAPENGRWKEEDRFELGGGEEFGSSFSSDGRNMVGIYQSNMIPPDLFVADLNTKQVQLLTELNPEFKNIQLGQIETLDWKNKYGSTAHGKLIKPVGYERGKRYPLVIMATYPVHEFVSDIGYTTAFAPQVLANAGFLVLFAKYSNQERAPRTEYPGQIATEYDWMSMIECAIDLLAEDGMADKDNVGIIGFSRTSWLTDFAITHSKYHFKAVSSADSTLYEYSTYFDGNSMAGMKSSEFQMGGPPLGNTLKNWLEFSPAFNVTNVRVPVLKEFTGRIDFFEMFISFARQGKPIDLFYYPEGAHPLNTPRERVASLQRNVDWFRFWMQGYEGKAPDYDADQYVRWHTLREQQEWNDHMRASGKDPSAEFLRQSSLREGANGADRPPAAKEFLKISTQ